MLHRFPMQRNSVLGLTISGDGRLLASMTIDGEANLWNLETLEHVTQFDMRARGIEYSKAFLFHPSEPRLIYASGPTGAVMSLSLDGSNERQLWSHRSEVRILAIRDRQEITWTFECPIAPHL